MTMMTKLLASGAGLAALMAAAPAAAQYAYGYQQPYAQPYGYAYGYQQQNVTSMAAQQCAAAVQARLQNRGNTGVGGILGAVLGVRTPMATSGRVVSFTRVTPRRNDVRVTGLATSGQAAAYSPYGYGAYGSYGYAYQPDLSFSCRVDYRGRIRDVDINRRR